MILYKYQAAGNDFILVYSPDKRADFGIEEIKHLCDRKLGIGSDGFIIIESHPKQAFTMRFYNNDGSSGMMCGNGGRCVVDFAARAGIVPNSTDGSYVFEAPDGLHRGRVLNTIGPNSSIVEVQLCDMQHLEKVEGMWRMNTGADHLVVFREDLQGEGLMSEARRLRFDERFAPAGVNVDFVQLKGRNNIKIRTYEKGVEAETLSCGTGVVASVIASYMEGYCSTECNVETTRNRFQVKFCNEGNSFSDIRLIGDTELVFRAEYPVDRIF